jgi:hypothetical protein
MRKDVKTFITVNPDEPYWACRSCWPSILEIGFIRDVGAICYLKDVAPCDGDDRFIEGSYVFILLAGQGHRDDEVVIEEKPTKTFSEDAQWNTYSPTGTYLSLCQGVEIHKAFLKHASKLELKRPWGWMVERWLNIKMVSLIERWENKFGMTVEEYYKDFYEKRLNEFNAKLKANENVQQST